MALLCALVAGPAGLGSAVHVARVDLLGARASTAASLEAASSRSDHPAHEGPTCAICQALQTARGVVPATAGFGVAARVTVAVPQPPTAHRSDAFVPAVAGRSPPRAS